MKLQFLSAAAVALMAAPMLHAQTTTTLTPAPTAAAASQSARVGARSRMGPQRGHQNYTKNLDLTADQQAKINAIRSRYAAQMKTTRPSFTQDREAMKAARTSGDTAAMRSLRDKMRAAMAPAMKLRQQQMAETRAVLTPEQQKKFDARQARSQTRPAFRGMRGGRGMRAPHSRPMTPTRPNGSAD